MKEKKKSGKKSAKAKKLFVIISKKKQIRGKARNWKVLYCYEIDLKDAEKIDIKKLVAKIQAEKKASTLFINFPNNLKFAENFLCRVFQLKQEKNFLIAVKGIGYDADKELLKLKRRGIPIVDIFFPRFESGKMHWAGGGLNHVLLNLMKKNIIALGINLDELLERIAVHDYGYFSKLLQNIAWARKRGVNLCLFSSELFDPLDCFHFLLCFCSTQQALSALNYAQFKLKFNKEIFEHKAGEVYVYKSKEKIKLVELLNALSSLSYSKKPIEA
ncbi:MAG: hypothetical protein QXE64_00045 [Candidatus Pacearchaeota archaeon]